ADARGLTGAADSSDTDKTAQRDFDGQVFQIVTGGVGQPQARTGGTPVCRGHWGIIQHAGIGSVTSALEIARRAGRRSCVDWSPVRKFDLLSTAQILARQRCFAAQDFLEAPLKYNLSSTGARAGPQVHD